MSLPAAMRAVGIRRPGPPDVLEIVTRPVPRPEPGEVTLKVAAAGVNRPDVLQRLGRYPAPPGASDIPGLEIAGTVAAVGEGVHDHRPGDALCALVAGGGYAEYCAAPAALCLPVPRGLSLPEAASLPESFFTVWTNVFERGGLKGAETLLVQGGASGVGVAAIQIARALGHRVFATAGTPEKCAACEKLGADRAIDYTKEDFAEEVRRATGGRGADVILDMVGGNYVPRELSCLADDGRLVFIAWIGGARAGIDVAEVTRRRLTLTGSTLRGRSVAFKAAIAESLRGTVWPLIEAGKVRPVVCGTFPLADAAGAHEMMESGRHIGKIVLTVP